MDYQSKVVCRCCRILCIKCINTTTIGGRRGSEQASLRRRTSDTASAVKKKVGRRQLTKDLRHLVRAAKEQSSKVSLPNNSLPKNPYQGTLFFETQTLKLLSGVPRLVWCARVYCHLCSPFTNFSLPFLSTKMTDAKVNYRVDRVTFSGKEEEFVHFMEQFESRMYLLNLKDALLDNITAPLANNDETVDALATRTATEADGKRYRVWCELTQCLDRKSLMLVRRHKPNGAAAWKALMGHYKSSERPRIHKTLSQLTSMKMTGCEQVADYLSRAEELQMDLAEAGEPVTDSMFIAMLLKGLSTEYDNIVTLLNYGATKDYAAVKQDLINFANSRPALQQESGSAFHSRDKPHGVKCFGCGKLGHKKNECRSGTKEKERNTKGCFNCGRAGHFARDCRAPKKPGNSGGGTGYRAATPTWHAMSNEFSASCRTPGFERDTESTS